MPLTVPKPMLALLSDKVPTGPQWSYEVKWDGYRCLAVKDGTNVKLMSRNGADLSTRYPAIVAAIRTLKAKTVVLDGEIVAVDDQGRPSFQALQHTKTASGFTLVYYAFDLLHLNGRDRWKEPLKVRRELLRATVAESHVLLSEPLEGTPDVIERELRALGLEGIVAKRTDSRYEPNRRSGVWTKVKFQPSQDFVIGGLTPDHERVESLIVGVYEGKKLIATGNVRGGLTVPLRRQLHALLAPLKTAKCPFANLPNARKSHWYEGITAEDMEKITWVKPQVVAEIAFTEWTSEV